MDGCIRGAVSPLRVMSELMSPGGVAPRVFYDHIAGRCYPPLLCFFFQLVSLFFCFIQATSAVTHCAFLFFLFLNYQPPH